MSVIYRVLIGIVLVLLPPLPAMAQTSEMREMDDAVANAYAKGTLGPATIALKNTGTLQLPKDFVFVPPEASRRLMHGMGNSTGDTLAGIVIPAGTYSSWFITVAVRETGYVSASTLASFDHEEIRGTMRAATRAGNAQRMQLGSSPLDIGAWLEPPIADAKRMSFTTAVRVFESGPSSGDEDSVNLDMLLFGRKSTIEIGLVAGLSNYTQYRAAFDAMAAAVDFVPGERNADYAAGRDQLATHVLDVVFGGRTLADIAAEAAEDAAEAKRRAALPPPADYSQMMKLVFFGMLGLMGLALAALALRRGGGGDEAPARDSGLNRALRSQPRR